MSGSELPIHAALPALRAALDAHDSVVLSAPAGAGKSTVVPLVLLAEPWVRGRRILMLEPRRLAARAVAGRMASTLGEPVGRTVGYRMRGDTRVSQATRLEVITEGVLTRMLQSDPALEGVAAVLFDEFHERSLQADLALALALDARETLEASLKILVMSATLETEAVAALLGGAPVVRAVGRSFPVETCYAGAGAPPLPEATARGTASPEQQLARLVLRVLGETHGDVLVFLAGGREIRRVAALLESAGGPARVLPLYGDLPAAAQDAALTPVPGVRRVVLATNIAETSLTLEGVRVVVDSGLARRLRFDPQTGMSRLALERISRASAEQRQGRAGRLEAGVCYRLWSEAAQRSLVPFTPAEILEADLAPLALELAQWGAREAGALRWLDPPPPALLASARDLLGHLGALERERISAHGRAMARLPVHPRLAHMLLRARELGALALAAELAALLSERDLLRGLAGGRDADIRTRLEILRGESGAAADRFALQSARAQARELVRQVERLAGPAEAVARDMSVGALLALAFPDRIGALRPGGVGRFALANGRGAHFPEAQSLSRQGLIVALDLDDRERDARILLAAPLEREALETVMAGQLGWREIIEWSRREQAVVARRELRLDQLLLETRPLPAVSPERAREAMLEGVRELGIGALPWDRDTRDLQARVAFVRGLAASYGEWPDLADAALAVSLDTWLAPWLDGVMRREHLARIPLAEALRARLGWERLRELDVLAPTHLEVPSGSRIRIDYLDASAPAVAVRLQEVFGLAATPQLGGGRAPVTFKLLSPAHRPVQVTRDLASFWRRGYAEVRKDLRGRYPKHHWPDDPLAAAPVRGVRRRP